MKAVTYVEQPEHALIQTYNGHHFYASDYAKGTLILGATGSGKSSSVIQHLTLGLLTASPKMGGIITTAKGDDLAKVMRLIRHAGREDDVIVIGASSGHTIPWLATAKGLTPEGASAAHIIYEMIETAREIGASRSIQSQDPFWDNHLIALGMVDAAREIQYQNLAFKGEGRGEGGFHII
jgi:hypothetical protein